MSPERATCFRCDWEGEGRGGAPCPMCGAPLFVRAKVRERRVENEPILLLPGPLPEASPQDAAFGRETGPRRAVVVLTALALVAVSLFAVVRTRQPGLSSSSVPLPGGVLIYAARGTDGSIRLFRWDLESRGVSAGPIVPRLDSLVPADPLNRGWVGVITRSPSDVLTVSTLRSLAPDASMKPLLSGKLVAFDSLGSSVVGVTEGSTTSGCLHRLVISAREIVSGTRDRQYAVTTCDRVLTLARARGTTYLTLRHGHRTSVEYVGLEILHDILDRYALMSVSATSDMLVVSSRNMVGFPEATPPVLGATGPAALFFKGTGALDPIPFAEGTAALSLGDVLAWSPDSTAALVFGRLGTTNGIFELTMGPGASPRRPTLVAATREPAWASYVDQSTAFVSMGGGIYALHNGNLERLSLPSGAPPPVGPLIWIR